MKNKDNQRKEALNRLSTLCTALGVDKSAVSLFEMGKIPLSVEYFPGLPIATMALSDEPELEQKVRNFEKRLNCTAYYVVNSCNVFLSILYVSNYTEDWDYERPDPHGYITSAVYDLSGQFMGADDFDFGDCQYVVSNSALKRIV